MTKTSGKTKPSPDSRSAQRGRAGTPAPGFTLTSNTGSQVNLADFRGKSVLLYFQEGLSCQPCWDQIRDLEDNQAALKAAGVDAVVSITTDPANLIGQKVTDEKLSTEVLSDPAMQVSQAYSANKYGMMGDMRDGHSFVLVGPDSTIGWRAERERPSPTGGCRNANSVARSKSTGGNDFRAPDPSYTNVVSTVPNEKRPLMLVPLLVACRR